MKYEIGTTVVLNNGKSIYITDYDESGKTYLGFDVDDSNPQKCIRFYAADVLMKV